MSAPAPAPTRGWVRTAVTVAIILIVAASAHSVCDLQFDCGCLPAGFGGIDHCNVHVAATPDCPWCTGGPIRIAWVGGIIVLAIAAALFLGRRRGPWELFGAGMIGYAVGALVAGLVAAIVTGYPEWLGIAL